MYYLIFMYTIMLISAVFLFHFESVSYVGMTICAVL